MLDLRRDGDEMHLEYQVKVLGEVCLPLALQTGFDTRLMGVAIWVSIACTTAV